MKKKNSDGQRFARNAVIMVWSAATLYFLGVCAAKPTARLVEYMNNPAQPHTLMQWTAFGAIALIGATFVCTLILLGDYAKGELLTLMKKHK